MIRRCHAENIPQRTAQYYRDKGITVCDEWRYSYENFREWALENGYEDNLTIDRIDSDKNYCPENCQWITKSENSRKAVLDWKKKPISEHRSEVGHFMVIEKVKVKCSRFVFDAYRVIQTGLYKSEANMIAERLNSGLPVWEHRYMARVTKNCKTGQLVRWEDTGQYLNSKKR